ncbi:MAG TPA: GDP-mannose 4,6-dehydratase, partial [Flavobacteriales bacterium]|nr:GDP-mannose 4,6-dehydratase [Flavobacteriales bacterium]
FYFAGSSEMFGNATQCPQNELTPFQPRSVYGISKLAGYHLVRNYRENHGFTACTGILFNHESPLRGIEFVTRKISLGMAEIAHKKKNRISLGNLNAERDWGFSGDYVKAMWMMLQQKNPKDYVIATGKTHSVREFAEKAAQAIDLEIEWMADKDDEVGVSKDTGDTIITVNKSFNRPAEIDHLLGDSRLANNELGWKPEVDFEGLVEMMVQSDLKRVEQGAVWF